MGDLYDATQDPDDDATDPSEGMGQELLRNFIHLVTAVRWATMRITSEGHCKIILFHLQQYLVTLLTMFPESVVSPNNHFTLHLVECLRDFGPVHSWWSFPFERYNGVLQRIKTNRKLGS